MPSRRRAARPKTQRPRRSKAKTSEEPRPEPRIIRATPIVQPVHVSSQEYSVFGRLRKRQWPTPSDDVGEVTMDEGNELETPKQ